MVRLGGILVGFGFVTALLLALGTTLWTMANTEAEPERNTAEFWHRDPRPVNLPSDGPLGRFDLAQVQRGGQVFREVCAACHSLNLVHFRDFADLGYNEDEVKALAAGWPIQTPADNPETGEATTRAPIPSDRLPSPFANDIAARAANNNAVPPDLSLMVKAREDGANYIYSLLTGYREVPADLPENLRPSGTLNYNPWFHSLNIAMVQPLSADGQVTYGPGNPQPTVDQMARDVTAFLVWTAEPELNQRHRAGLVVLGFLAIFTILAFLSYRAVWADKKGH
jgi:ubiquinol-cytochrome c reductase cytochrome c1 subunit